MNDFSFRKQYYTTDIKSDDEPNIIRNGQVFRSGFKGKAEKRYEL